MKKMFGILVAVGLFVGNTALAELTPEELNAELYEYVLEPCVFFAGMVVTDPEALLRESVEAMPEEYYEMVKMPLKKRMQEWGMALTGCVQLRRAALQQGAGE